MGGGLMKVHEGKGAFRLLHPSTFPMMPMFVVE